MKKIFSFVLLFAVTLASTFMLSACEEHRVLDNIMFTYNRTTYKSGATIVFDYQEEVDFNRETVRFISMDNLNSSTSISISDLTVKYEYAAINSSDFVTVDYFPFFEQLTTKPGCGVYRFTFSKDDVELQFSVKVLKNDTIHKYRIEFYSNAEDVVTPTSETSYIMNASGASSIRWRVAGMSNAEIEQLGEFPELYVMTAEEYQQAGSRQNYTGTRVLDLQVDILSSPGQYYIYGKFIETNNYSGGNTVATSIIVR